MIVAFDLGGVLVRICRTWGQAMRVAGFQARPEHEDLWFDDAPPFKAFQSGEISESEYLVCLAEFLGFTALLEDGGEGARDLGRLVHNGILQGEYAGATELVQDIHARGWQSACLSNTNAIHWEVLTDPAYFPAVAALNHKFASHLLNLEKPLPAIYRHFEEATASDPTEIVFFDDLPANVEAARACGWSAQLIDHDGDTVAQMRAALGNMATWHR